MPCAFTDNTKHIDERATEPTGFRTKPHIKQVIQRAAALSGVEDSVFTMSATYQPALATIAAHERTHLQPGDHAASFEALDTPPQPTDALRNAVARHQARSKLSPLEAYFDSSGPEEIPNYNRVADSHVASSSRVPVKTVEHQ
ncbi:DUF1778 domain-containing protein [Ahrensia marina]|uniref:type II toxin-antitoxin system TacA family antitoxin n=1 Tax=Ahrensia marina TaxID=1514904 RepID=UPI0035CEA00C